MKKIFLSVLLLNSINFVYSATNISYDVVGKTYDTARCADPEVMQGLVEYMNPMAGKKYLDVSCGSGNYTIALYNQGLDIIGIDISQEMLKKAQAKGPTIPWLQGDVQALPFEDNTFDGMYCIHAIHHYKDLELAFKEMYRVLAPGGTLIVFTLFVEQCERQWLGHYFPFLEEIARKITKTESALVHLMKIIGFAKVECKKYFVTKNTKDLTVYGGKYKPEVYLDPVVRAGMTPFNMPEYADLIEEGCNVLRADIASGEINNVIARYESDLGEHAYVIATKA